MLKYYVLNYDMNRNEIVPFNIFDNWILEEAVIKEIKKYLRSPKKYSKDELTGFPAFSKELGHLIQWQEWSRTEYEICVAAFQSNQDKIKNVLEDNESETFDVVAEQIEKELDKETKKVDCFYQAIPNIDMIAREVIYQYKNSKKDK